MAAVNLIDAPVPRDWLRFAALGDSFTEGLMDELRPDGRHLGWADRVARALADRAPGGEGVAYANLAVRGRLVRQVMAEQVPAAVALRPDLASVAVGINDALRPRFDLNPLATALENGVRDLRRGGSDVLLFAFGDPARRSLAMAPVRDRIRAYNSAVRAIAEEYGCYLVSFWEVAAYDDERLWDEDRLHLNPAGHALAAQTALSALGLLGDEWRTPAVPGPQPRALAKVRTHARWAGRHLGPWILRRARRESSGDDISAKDPQWVRVLPSAVAVPQKTK